MLTRQEIQTIIEAQGLNAHFQENINKRGDGTSRVYVQASKHVGQVKGNVHIALGRFEQVQQMSREELAETVKQKFTEKLAEKMSAQGLL